MSWRTLAATLLAAAIPLLPSSAQAQTLYAATGAGGTTGNLYIVNQATAAATVVGPILVGALPIAITGLAFHPTTGVLYAITSNNSPNFPQNLVTINPATAAATIIGALGIGGADISFASSGILYMSSGQATNLYTVNLTTGAATLVGATGTGDSGSGLAIDSGGTAYFSGNGSAGSLDRLSLSTGAATIGPVLTGAPIAGSINAMKFSGSNALFGVNNTNPGGNPDNLVTINVLTGAVTNIGALPASIDGLAFAGINPPGAAPTLSEWALIALALILFSAGASAVARRRG